MVIIYSLVKLISFLMKLTNNNIVVITIQGVIFTKTPYALKNNLFEENVYYHNTLKDSGQGAIFSNLFVR